MNSPDAAGVRVSTPSIHRIASDETGIFEVDCAHLLNHACHLIADHWDEVALNKQVMVLKPMISRYQELEAVDALFILVAYIDGVIVGYSVNFLNNHIHYADLKCATNDLLFIDKSYRSGSTGLKLISQTEKHAKQKGAQMMLWHAKQSTALDRIMQRKQYRVQDIVYSKEL